MRGFNFVAIRSGADVPERKRALIVWHDVHGFVVYLPKELCTKMLQLSRCFYVRVEYDTMVWLGHV